MVKFKKVKPKVNLEKEVKTDNISDDELKIVTEERLLEICPKEFLTAFKKAKSAGDRADFLKKFDDARKEANRVAKAMDEFESLLKRWFIQNLPAYSATGVAGKHARVQIVDKRRVSVVDWDKFYAFVRKNSAFEFFERKVKLSAAEDRWAEGKQVPGLEPFNYKSISLTKK